MASEFGIIAAIHFVNFPSNTNLMPWFSNHSPKAVIQRTAYKMQDSKKKLYLYLLFAFGISLTQIFKHILYEENVTFYLFIYCGEQICFSKLALKQMFSSTAFK